MKKYLGLILSAVILLSSIAVNAETNTPKTTEEAVMSVELIENNALEEDIQEREIDKSNINSDESQDIPASNSEKEYDCLEAGEDAATEIMSLIHGKQLQIWVLRGLIVSLCRLMETCMP